MQPNWERLRLNNKGFTMIELMVTVIIVSLVLTTVYGMMTAGNRIFAQGDAKADVQSNLRVSGNFISDKLRYASEIIILPDKPADISASGKEYIYVEDGVLKYYDGHTISNVPGALEGVETEIYFEDQNTQSVFIKINGTLREQLYSIETSAYLLNIGDSVLADSSGEVIEFQPGIPVIADINARPITEILIKTDPVGTTTVPVDGQLEFIADVSPEDASRKTVEWVLQPSSVTYATIGSTSATTGLLKFSGAVAGDSVTVYANALDGSGVISKFPIIVTVTDGAIVSGASIEVESAYDVIFKKNGSMQMTAKITPPDSSDKAVTWSLNPGSNVATISPDGLLTTGGSNTGSGTIMVTATLASGESDTKTIQTIDNITGIKIEEVEPPTTATNNKYIGKIRCLLSLSNIPATASNGVSSIKWDIVGSSKVTSSSLTPNSDGTLSLNVDGQNKTAYFSIRATITPISGDGYISNLVTIDFNN